MGKKTSRWLLCWAVAIAACGGAKQPTCVASPAANRVVSVFEPSRELEVTLAALPFRVGKAASNLSDVATDASGHVLIVTDEGTEVAAISDRNEARIHDLLPILDAGSTPLSGLHPDEIDLEAAAYWNQQIVLCGSASLKRQKAKPGKDNVARMAEVIPASGEGNDHSNYVFVLKSADEGKRLELLDLWDLRAVLLADPLLQAFRELPSKDNGIDVEGVAADAEHLYFGLRGPALRGHALIVRTDWKGQNPTLHFLSLDGLGVRGLMREPSGKGFYVLAGPTMDLDGPFAIYAWDGHTSVFDGDEGRSLARLTEVPSDAKTHPEALFMWRGALCTLADGPKGGAPACATNSGLGWPL